MAAAIPETSPPPPQQTTTTSGLTSSSKISIATLSKEMSDKSLELKIIVNGTFFDIEIIV